MTTFLIATIIGGLVFGACFAVLWFKGRRANKPVHLHMCGQGEDCHCRKGEAAKDRFDLP